MLQRSLLFWVVWCPVFLLWGCATQPVAKPTGAMLVVRLLVKQEPIEAVTLQVTQGDQTEPMASVNGLLYSRIGGRSVDYLFPVPLAAGRYKINQGSGLPPFELGFEVPVGAPVYIGRVLLSKDGAPALEDRHTDDVPTLRDAMVQLRDLTINTQLGNLRPERSPELGSGTALAGGGAMEWVPVIESVADQLPVASREAFKRYLKLRKPRAFAVSDDGAYGVASGQAGVERAMLECNKQAPKKPCRLFSVDETAIVWRNCAARTSHPNWWLRLADVAPQDAAALSSECPPRP